MATTLKENRAKWTEALRSGDYRQVVGTLSEPMSLPDDNMYEERILGYCCLGVLCRVFEQNNPRVIEHDLQGNALGEYEHVMEWVGLKESDGGYRGNDTSLAVLNDDNLWDFEDIADFIDTNPEGLFTE